MKKKRIIIVIISLIGLITIGIGIYLNFRVKNNEYYFGSEKEKIVVGNLIANDIEFKETDDKLQYILTFSLTNTFDDKLIAKNYQFKIVDKDDNILTVIPGESFNNLVKDEITYYSFTVPSNANKLIIEKLDNKG